MQSSQDQPAHLQSIREEYVQQISLYGKARCRFEIRMMAVEVRKMDVRVLGKRENRSDDGGDDGEKNTVSKPPQDDDALLLARASDNLLLPRLGIREHRQSLITDEHLPTKPKNPLAQRPERRLSVPPELLTKEWPQLTTTTQQQHDDNDAQPGGDGGGDGTGTVSNSLTMTTTTTTKTTSITTRTAATTTTTTTTATTATKTKTNNLVSRPESVYLPITTTTRNDCIGISRRNNSLDNDQPASSSRLLLPHHSHHHPHHHESSSSSSSSSSNYSSHTQTEDSQLDSRDFFSFSSHIIPPLPTTPPRRLPDFEYGDLIRQVRVPEGKAKAASRRGSKKGKSQSQSQSQSRRHHQVEIVVQPIPNPFSPPRLHRVVRLTRTEHDRLQKRVSRQCLLWLLILLVPCPWLMLLFGYGMMDEPLVDWWTEGDVRSGFAKGEKTVALCLGFVVMALWIGVGLGVGVGVGLQ